MSEKTATGPRIVVLTGGIASGKTAVSDLLTDAGLTVIDTDVVAREVVEPGSPGLDQIVQVFGDSVLQADGRLDRRALRKQVFDSVSARKSLESITHPLIKARVQSRLQEANDEAVVVLVVPLLLESGLFGDADEVVVVDVSETTQIGRLMLRDAVTEEQAQKILDAQISRQQRLQAADHVIDNSGTPSELETQVGDYIRQLKRRIKQPSD